MIDNTTTRLTSFVGLPVLFAGLKAIAPRSVLGQPRVRRCVSHPGVIGLNKMPCVTKMIWARE